MVRMNKSFSLYKPHPSHLTEAGCIVVIGMAASGKTTVGRELAQLLGMPQMDADNLIEATYGAPLQAVTERMSKEEFLDLESAVIRSIKVRDVVLSTGGSVVYRPDAMKYLATLGPIVHIAVPLDIVLLRIARKPERGLAIAPGQTVEDLYHERRELYEKYANLTVEGGEAPAQDYARQIAALLSAPVGGPQ